MINSIRIENSFQSWRDAARRLLLANIPPSEIVWVSPDVAESLLPAIELPQHDGATPQVPSQFVERAKWVASHHDPNRWGLLYRMLWRLTHGEAHLLEVMVDDGVREFDLMEKAVRRDRHKMTAFVRFRKVQDAASGTEHFIAWHRPDHFIVRLTAPFFRERFMSMHWTILTPDESVIWDGHELCFGPGVPASAAPVADELESLWTTYYGSIFNPARINLRAMQKEMPRKHWATLPETRAISDLLREAPARVEEMVKRTAHVAAASTSKSPRGGCANTGSARDFFPERISLPQLRGAIDDCKGCDLYCHATQPVFGEGPKDAFVVFVGEQPGDQEDLAGKPFIGPSGQLLDQVLEEVGIDRKRDVYVTNAVKHFKFEPRGKRRIHSKPTAREVAACRPWLEAEIELIKPSIVVCLGATAAQSLLGSGFRVTKHRGEPITDQPWAPWVMATYHPSALLRMPDEAARHEARVDFANDLRQVAKQIKKVKAGK
jgi:DNA polymerase